MKADCMIKNGKVLTPTGTVICGVAVLDASAAALKLAEMLVDLRKTEDLRVSRHLTYQRASDQEMEKARKHYWE